MIGKQTALDVTKFVGGNLLIIGHGYIFQGQIKGITQKGNTLRVVLSHLAERNPPDITSKNHQWSLVKIPPDYTMDFEVEGKIQTKGGAKIKTTQGEEVTLIAPGHTKLRNFQILPFCSS